MSCDELLIELNGAWNRVSLPSIFHVFFSILGRDEAVPGR